MSGYDYKHINKHDEYINEYDQYIYNEHKYEHKYEYKHYSLPIR